MSDDQQATPFRGDIAGSGTVEPSYANSGYASANHCLAAREALHRATDAFEQNDLERAIAHANAAFFELRRSTRLTRELIENIQKRAAEQSNLLAESIQAPVPPTPQAVRTVKKYNKTSPYWKTVGKNKKKGKAKSKQPPVRKGSKLPEATKKKIAAAAKARKRDASGHFIPAKKAGTTKKK